METTELLKKYIERNFNLSNVKVEPTSSFSVRITLIDGQLDLLNLGDKVIVYYNDDIIERVVYNDRWDDFVCERSLS